jgi:hypothetical protein
VSWSSYDVSTEAAKIGGEEGRGLMMKALDYIESQLPPSDIKGKRVIMGEYGFHLGQVDGAIEQKRCAKNIMKWCLEWGCPFVLFWEMYCNEIEPSNEKHRGFWLIDQQGDKQPAWYLHRDFLRKANRFVEDYQKEHGRLPSQDFYGRTAISWLEDNND